MTRFALNYVELAKALGISRGGLLRFRALPNRPKARADGRHDVKKWAKFISANATRVKTGTETIPTGPKDVARINLMRIQALREQVRLNRESEQLLGEVKQLMREWSSRLLVRLDRLARTDLPPLLCDKNPREIGRILRDKMRRAWNDTPLRVCVDIDEDTGKLRARDVTNVIEFHPPKTTRKTDPANDVAL